MDEVRAKIGCAECQITLEGPAEPKADDVVSCPSCGLTEKFETVRSEVYEWVSDQMAQAIQTGLRDTVVDNEFIKFTINPFQQRTHRFVLIQDDDS